VAHLEPKVDVCDRRYVFDAQPPPNATKPLVFNPTGRCPAFQVAPEIAGPAQEKERNDEQQFAQLVKFNTPVAPIRTGLDGGMNRVFLAQVGGNIPPARVPAPQTTAGASTDTQQPSTASSFFGALFGSKPATEQQTKVASTDATLQERGGGSSGGFFGRLFSSNSNGQNGTAGMRGSEPTTTATVTPQQSKPASHSEVASAGLHAKPHTETSKPEPPPQVAETAKLKPKPQQDKPQQQEANANTPPVGNNGAALNGSQPVVPAGSFDSRWGAMQ